MERHKCKLCSRSFSNGRALGGHMRSHLMNMKIYSKPKEVSMNRFETELASSAPSSPSLVQKEDEEGEETVRQYQEYSLRESPKKNSRFADPEFSFAIDAGSDFLHDRESETDSPKNSRKRSNRMRNSSKNPPSKNGYYNFREQKAREARKRIKFEKTVNKFEYWAEAEQGSSVSDATTEEDVAFCLMLLSRDAWKTQKNQTKEKTIQYPDEEIEEKEEEFDEIEEESGEFYGFKSRSRGKYTCETCNKVFRSYQALGGHRASHKKNQIQALTQLQDEEDDDDDDDEEEKQKVEKEGTNARNGKIYECPFCFRVFGSGQALGGHKRSHTIAPSTSTSIVSSGVKDFSKVRLSFIDLNLPAPVDDEEFSQVELSETRTDITMVQFAV